MAILQKFGGNWTEEKLNIFTSYLDAYIIALQNQKFKKIYIDAFAGTGEIETSDGGQYLVGSAKRALASEKDNLGKAKGFAEYARKNPGVGRIQLIRMSKDAAGKHKFKRLDMSKTAIRDKVSHAINTDELDHIFDTDGVIE